MTDNKYVEKGYSNAYVEEDNASPTIYAEDNYSKNYTKNNDDDVPSETSVSCSDNYVEGDKVSSTGNENNSSVNCDLTVLLEKIQEIASQNIELKKEIVSLKDEVETIARKAVVNNSLNLAIDTKLIEIEKQVDNLVTTEYIDSKVPFVDDINIEVFKKGTIVVTSISGGFHTVESSCFLPDGNGGYSVVYTLAKEIDGVMQHSQFHSSYVKLGHPELLFRKSDYPDLFPDYKE